MYGMGGYSNYGGMGSYGSYGSYGGGYGGYGSSYNSYGSSPYANRSGTPTVGNKANQSKGEGEKQADPNNPNVPIQERQKQQQICQRKLIFEQWFKMMGGLRSIVQLGFATIALANFCSRSADIFKKFLEFTKQACLSMGGFIESKIPTKIFTNLSTPQKRGKAIKSIVLLVIRVFAALLLMLGVKLRNDIKKQAELKRQELERELQRMKLQQVQLVQQEEKVEKFSSEPIPELQQANL